MGFVIVDKAGSSRVTLSGGGKMSVEEKTAERWTGRELGERESSNRESSSCFYRDVPTTVRQAAGAREVLSK